MEIVVMIILFVAIGILANRHGYDSRDVMRSEEKEFASYGFTWLEWDSQLTVAGDIQVAQRTHQPDQLSEVVAATTHP
ncbi:MAG: hypothetical protein M3Q29_10730 [Chloroflexota bacterium]|nr:hypothetical protein [Chloroflexota bacterium]